MVFEKETKRMFGYCTVSIHEENGNRKANVCLPYGGRSLRHWKKGDCFRFKYLLIVAPNNSSDED